MRISPIVLAGLLCGCSSAPVYKNIDQDETKHGSAVLAMPYLFESKDKFVNDGTCKATFTNYTTGDRFAAEITPPKGFILISVPEGMTQLREIYCYTRAQWTYEVDPEWQVRLQPGKINVLGILQFTQLENRDLGMYWKSLTPSEMATLTKSLGKKSSLAIETYPAKLKPVKPSRAL